MVNRSFFAKFDLKEKDNNLSRFSETSETLTEHTLTNGKYLKYIVIVTRTIVLVFKCKALQAEN